jgi:hypothetical protein
MLKISNPINDKYYGFYKGIVIQNNDPSRRGRVKIFTRELAPQIIQHLYFNQNSTSGENATGTQLQEDFTTLFAGGQNIETCMTDEFRTFAQLITRWAEQASPLVGGGSAGYYNAQKDLATKSSSNKNEKRFNSSAVGQTDQTVSGDSITPDGSGVNTAALVERNPEIGGHESYLKDNTNNPNTHNNSISPVSYTNQTSGMFGVPNVGAHVWVFFENGDLEYPVYFAYNYDDKDWQGAYHAIDGFSPGKDYPDSSENVKELSKDQEFFLRNKTVLKSKAGSIELVDSDQTESIRINHYNGSCIHLTPFCNLDFSNTNKTTLINEDNWTTVKGINSTNVQKDNDIMIDGNNYHKIGKPKFVQKFLEWLEKYTPVALMLAGFETMRARVAATSPVYGIPQPTMQQAGTPDQHPVFYEYNPTTTVTGEIENEPIETVNNSIQIPFKEPPAYSININDTPTAIIQHYKNDNPSLNQVKDAQKPEQLPTVAEMPSPSSKKGTWTPNTQKTAATEQLGQLLGTELSKIEKDMSPGGTEIVHILKDKVETIGAVMNNLPAVRVDTTGDISVNSVLIDQYSTYPNYREHPYYEPTGLGAPFPGGNYTIVAQNVYNVIAGAGGIQLKTHGITQIGGGVVNISGDAETTISSNGNVRINAAGKIQIGSKTTDNIVTLEHPVQVAVDSGLGIKTNLTVGGSSYTEGETYIQHITAPCEIQETESTKVYGETCSGAVIGYINMTELVAALATWGIIATEETGQLAAAIYGLSSESYIASLQAAQKQEQDQTVLQQITEEIAKHAEAVILTESSLVFADTQQLVAYPHAHAFKNLPLTLVAGNKDVRASAINGGLNEGKRGVASPQKHEKKQVEEVELSATLGNDAGSVNKSKYANVS